MGHIKLLAKLIFLGFVKLIHFFHRYFCEREKHLLLYKEEHFDLSPWLLGGTLVLLGIYSTLTLQDQGDVDFSCYTGSLQALSENSQWLSIAQRNVFGVHSNYTLYFWLPIYQFIKILAKRAGYALDSASLETNTRHYHII